MRKTDINQYGSTGNLPRRPDVTIAGSMGKIIGKCFLTILAVCIIIGVIVGVALLNFIMSMKDEEMNYDLRKLKLNYTSFIYVNDANGNPVEYQSLYSGENRVWVDFSDIPRSMKDAIIAIEDKRFMEHEGVDWRRTLGAVKNLFSKADSSYGGSTITQQLIKNVTGEKDVSLTRKVKEIFRALNLEKKYSKDEILETYLNVVNFGSGCNGVQAAANLYFGKDIEECSIAECASIAGITQNPSKYTPLVHPEYNKERQLVVLSEMRNQNKITETQYRQALKDTENMVFVGKKTEDGAAVPVWNWYVDTMINDVTADLAEAYNVTEAKALDMIYHDGLKIYCAMDSEYQSIAESVMKDAEALPKNKKIDAGYIAMDYNGRVLAAVGGRGEKTKNLPWNNVTDTKRQPGSSIKPLVDYAPAIEMGVIHYSSAVDDEPIEKWDNGKPGPRNFNNTYIGQTTVQYALEKSLNAPAARILQQITPKAGFDFLKDKLHFTSLVPTDETLAMSIGGMAGVTVREVTAGFQMFANGGKYCKPYTYYYVEDHDGKVILDNRNNVPEQAIRSTTATIMHRLLNTTITGAEGSGYAAAIRGWEVFGKTGTTNDQKDSWFVGGTPYAMAGIWTGYREAPVAMNDTEKKYAISIWKAIMQKYLENKEKKSFTYDPAVTSALFCRHTGKLARSGVCGKVATGWYDKAALNKVGICDGAHGGTISQPESQIPSSELPESSQIESSSLPDLPSTPSDESSIPDFSFPVDSSVPDTSSAPVIPPYPPDSSESVPIPPEGGGSTSSSESTPDPLPSVSPEDGIIWDIPSSSVPTVGDVPIPSEPVPVG